MTGDRFDKGDKFVVTYHPLAKSLQSLIKHLGILYRDVHLELWLRFVAPENLFNYWGINFLVVAKLCPWREWLAYVNVMESGVLRV